MAYLFLESEQFGIHFVLKMVWWMSGEVVLLVRKTHLHRGGNHTSPYFFGDDDVDIQDQARDSHNEISSTREIWGNLQWPHPKWWFIQKGPSKGTL